MSEVEVRQTEQEAGTTPSTGAPVTAAHTEEATATAAAVSEPDPATATPAAATPSVPASPTPTTVPTSGTTSESTARPAVASVTRRRRAKGAAPAGPRPITGGLAIGFTPDELKAQAAKRAAWLQQDVEAHNAIRSEVAAKEARTSAHGLAIMLVVWAVVIAAIFWTVWSVMAKGLASMTEQNSRLPASTLIFNAFKAQLPGDTSPDDDSR